MRRALVTGGCGFIGSNLVKELVKQGWKVDIIDDMSSGNVESLSGLKTKVIPAGLINVIDLDNDVEISSSDEAKYRSDIDALIIEGDFAHPFVLGRIRRKKYDVVFHQAAIPRVLFSVENPSLTTHVNILSTTHLFEACIDSVERVVFASSSSVYGGADVLPTPETHAKDPKSPYAWQKSAIEDLSKIFSNLYDLDIVCLRYFNVFGPGQLGGSAYSTAVSAWCNAVANDLELRSDGDGSQSRDLCYVDNVVSANILAASSQRKFCGDTYNIACGDQTTNREILEYFKSKFSNIVVKDAPWRKGDVMHTRADITKAREELGYEPLVRFWEGLDKTFAFWNLN